jgi:hypothetical protein
MKYQYTGDIEVSIDGVGVIQPQQVFETDVVIDNPLFQEIQNQKGIQKSEEAPWKD